MNKGCYVWCFTANLHAKNGKELTGADKKEVGKDLMFKWIGGVAFGVLFIYFLLNVRF